MGQGSSTGEIVPRFASALQQVLRAWLLVLLTAKEMRCLLFSKSLWPQPFNHQRNPSQPPMNQPPEGVLWPSRKERLLAFDLRRVSRQRGAGPQNRRSCREGDVLCQGDPADSVFYLQKGRAKLTVVSQQGKEATITLLSAGDFVGEESLASVPGLRLATASAVNTCTALKIAQGEMARVMHDEPALRTSS